MGAALAGFSATATDNISVYWGQNSANGANTQGRLKEYCDECHREDIKYCQQQGKTILLSIGGATYSEGGFSDASSATSTADAVWNLFGSNTNAANRPFGSAVVDGFDFDFESSTQNFVPFAQRSARPHGL
ncbi:hypothetical protein RRF57_008472 [Xylaria bambusicola]|uniref:chitinase n=1 Tax=Xylaria bambusicola TaxID=326684 RepID=A0AAN7UN49_9PEZI